MAIKPMPVILDFLDSPLMKAERAEWERQGDLVRKHMEKLLLEQSLVTSRGSSYAQAVIHSEALYPSRLLAKPINFSLPDLKYDYGVDDLKARIRRRLMTAPGEFMTEYKTDADHRADPVMIDLTGTAAPKRVPIKSLGTVPTAVEAPTPSQWGPIPSDKRVATLEREVEALRGNEAILANDIQELRDALRRVSPRAPMPMELEGRRGVEWINRVENFMRRASEFRQEVQHFMRPFRGGTLQCLQQDVRRLEGKIAAKEAVAPFRKALKRKAAILSALNGEHQGETVMEWADRCGVKHDG